MDRAPALRRRALWALGLSYLAFISLGLPDGLLGVAWPSIRRDFELPVDRLGALLVAMTAGYTVSSFLSSTLSRKVGVGAILAGSCALTSASLFGYASAPAWPWMVSCGLLTGLGAGAIDASLNHYVSAHHSARSVAWMHAAFGVGISTGPLLMTYGLSSGHPWRWGYGVVGGIQALLMVCFALARRIWERGDARVEAPHGGGARLTETLQQPLAWLGVAVFWGYVGVEATAGQWMFTLYTEGRGVSATAAGFWVSAYWGALTVGRVVLGGISDRVAPHRLVSGCLTLAMLGLLLIQWDPSPALRLPTLALLGFSLAPVFPMVTAGTPKRLGPRHGANGIGMQIAVAGLGAALEPSAVGWLAGRWGLGVVGPALLFMGTWTLLAYAALLLLAGANRVGHGEAVEGP